MEGSGLIWPRPSLSDLHLEWEEWLAQPSLEEGEHAESPRPAPWDPLPLSGALFQSPQASSSSSYGDHQVL